LQVELRDFSTARLRRFGRNDKIRVGRNDKIRVGRNDKIRVGRNDKIRVGRNDKIRVGRNDKIRVGRNDKTGSSHHRLRRQLRLDEAPHLLVCRRFNKAHQTGYHNSLKLRNDKREVKEEMHDSAAYNNRQT
jgi:hypothetical protein